MTEIVAHKDAYLREMDSTVTAVAPGSVVLDGTVFYPAGGGQPSDSGVLIAGGDEHRVTGLKRIDGVLVHLVEEEAPVGNVSSELTGRIEPTGGTALKEGDAAHGVVDWDRRYQLMRTRRCTYCVASSGVTSACRSPAVT